MQKCSLCGGRVVNGRCEECGLPIPPEHNYIRHGETEHHHVVNGEEILHRVRVAPGKKPVYECDGEDRREHRPAKKYAAGKPRRNPITTFVIILILFCVLPSVITVLQEVIGDAVRRRYSYSYSYSYFVSMPPQEEQSPYTFKNLTEEL